MGKYRAYAEYKDSGVGWLGEVPSHWSQKRVRFLLENGSSGMKIGPFGSALKLEDMVEEGVKVYGQENVINNDFTLGKRRISSAKHEEMRVYDTHAGDLLVTMMGTSGRCQVVPRDAEIGIIDSHLLRLRSDRSEIVPELLRWIIDESPEVAYQVRRLGKGSIMHGLNSSIIKDLLLSLPEVDEQFQIATFLDRETAKIDRLIAKQEALIELLGEKQQAVISHAVTKGLDPDAPMKDSGVEWLGEIPAHWEACKLGHVSTHMQTGPFGSQLHAEDYREGGTPVINPAHMIEGVIQPDEKCAVDGAMVKQLAHHKLNVRDVIFARRGELGRCALVSNREEGWLCGTGSVKVTLDCGRYVPEFLVMFMQTSAARDALSLMSKGSTMENLNTEILGKLRVPLPSVEEQEVVVQHVSKHIQKVDDLLQQSGNVIALLQERRTALISAAVTGKIDVREEVAKTLPSVETALAVEILNRCAANCGRVKLQKLLFLAEYHGQIETDSNYQREAAGPMDGALLDRVESELESFGYYRRCRHADGSYSYLRMENAGKGAAQSEYPSKHVSKGLHIVNTLADKNTHECEAIATVYGAWNDLLIAGKETTRTAVIDEVMNQWHQNKRQTPRSEWLQWYDWVNNHMRPVGFGRSTKLGRGMMGNLLDGCR